MKPTIIREPQTEKVEFELVCTNARSFQNNVMEYELKLLDDKNNITLTIISKDDTLFFNPNKHYAVKILE